MWHKYEGKNRKQHLLQDSRSLAAQVIQEGRRLLRIHVFDDMTTDRVSCERRDDAAAEDEVFGITRSAWFPKRTLEAWQVVHLIAMFSLQFMFLAGEIPSRRLSIHDLQGVWNRDEQTILGLQRRCGRCHRVQPREQKFHSNVMNYAGVAMIWGRTGDKSGCQLEIVTDRN